MSPLFRRPSPPVSQLCIWVFSYFSQVPSDGALLPASTLLGRCLPRSLSHKAPPSAKGGAFYVNSRRSRSRARRSRRDTCTWDTPSTRAAFTWVMPR